MAKAQTPSDVEKFVWDSFTIIKKPEAKPVEDEKPKVKRPVPVTPPEPYRQRLRAYMEGLDLGGPGSGNFGHGGRPGEVGGSAGEGGGDGKAEERAAKEAEYNKLQANRAKEAQSAATSADLKAETEPGGRFEHEDQRMEAQHKTQQRLKQLMPKEEGQPAPIAIITSPTPQLIRTGEAVAEVLEEMKAAGMEMPARITIRHGVGTKGPGGVIKGVRTRGTDFETGAPTERREKHLEIHIPESLPSDVSLDDASEAVFGGQSDVIPKYAYNDKEYAKYDKFVGRTLKDVITHEMGHVQAGHRGDMPYGKLLQANTFGSTDQIRRAVMRVSEYAMTNQDEFVAEAFTKLYRGETLAEDSQKLYDALNGPKVPKR